MALNAIIDLLLNSAQFDSALDKSEKRIKGFAREAEKAGKIAGKIGAGLSVANIAGLEKLTAGSKAAKAGIDGLTGAMLLLGTVPLPIAIGVAAAGALATYVLGARSATQATEDLHKKVLQLTQTAEQSRDASFAAAQADLAVGVAASEAAIVKLEKSLQAATEAANKWNEAKRPEIAAGFEQQAALDKAALEKERANLIAIQKDVLVLTDAHNKELAARKAAAAEQQLEAEQTKQKQLSKVHADALNERLQAQMRFEDAILDAMQEQDKANDKWLEVYKDWQTENDKMGMSVEETSRKMSTFADQAARNMQTAFADFLFDPFKDGLDGMLKSFLQTIQRMIAEAAAAKIFESLGASGALGGLFSAIGLGARASGGPVSAGKPYLVGEKGPELMVPGASGSIVPNNALGGGSSVTINSVINMSGGGNKAELAQVLAARDRKLKADIATYMSRGYMPA